MRNQGDFERLADAMLGPRLRQPDLKSGSHSIHRLPATTTPRRTPVPSPPPLPAAARKPGAAPGLSFTPRRPPPLPKRAAAVLTPVPTPTPLREGARAERGMSRSSIYFLAAIAVAIIAMSIIGLAVLVPHADWALLQG